MPITTYLHPSDTSVDDKDITPLIEELYEKTGERWVVLASQKTKRRLWKKSLVVSYMLCKHLGDNPLGREVQIINFYVDGSGTSINTLVSKGHILAYVWGYLGGLAQGEERGEGRG